MKKLTLLLLLVLMVSVTLAQRTNEFIPKVNELFFYLNTSTTMFEVRKELQKNSSFYDFDEYKISDYTSLGVSFKYSSILLYPFYQASLSFMYNPGEDTCCLQSILVQYKPDGVGNCENQYNKLVSLFEPLRYISIAYNISNPGGIKVGEGYRFFIDSNSFQRYEPLLDISYEHHAGKPPFYTDPELYLLKIDYYVNSYYRD